MLSAAHKRECRRCFPAGVAPALQAQCLGAGGVISPRSPLPEGVCVGKGGGSVLYLGMDTPSGLFMVTEQPALLADGNSAHPWPGLSLANLSLCSAWALAPARCCLEFHAALPGGRCWLSGEMDVGRRGPTGHSRLMSLRGRLPLLCRRCPLSV